MEALQQLLAAHSQAAAWQTAQTLLTPNPLGGSPFDLSSLQLQLMLAAQQQNCPPSYHDVHDMGMGKPQRATSLNLPTPERQPFRDLHAHVYGINPPQAPLYGNKASPNSLSSSRSASSSGGRWAATTDQRDVVITEQLALIKSLNDTVSKQKQAAVEQDAVRSALEVQIAELRKMVAAGGPGTGGSAASTSSSADSDDGGFTSEAQVAYYKEHAEQWSGRSTMDRQQLVQVLRTLIASNKRYQQPLPPMCVKSECRCRNCWFLHAQIDENAWAAAWELHMSLR